MCGFAEELEYIETLSETSLKAYGDPAEIKAFLLKAATASCDFYIEHTPTDGIPYWDTGAPNLHKLGDYLSRPADPYNDFEPVDSSALIKIIKVCFCILFIMNQTDGTMYLQAKKLLVMNPACGGIIMQESWHCMYNAS